MNDRASSKYEKMWTSEKDKYYLVESPRSCPGAFLAMIVKRDQGAITIEDEAGVFQEIVAQMRDAGVELVTQEEHFRRQRLLYGR